ncbi:MAG TPA: response regulator [Planctomycetota bacterium]|nr:response regulator [Planctomycetota bacterium]
MPRLLLAEDQDDQRHLYADILKDAGFEVIEARNGAEVLALFQKRKPDILVLDIQMPGIDGIEALSKVVAKDRLVPVVLHSAYPAYKGNFLTWAADGFVVKSGEADDLLATVRRVCEERGIALPAPL